MTKNSFIYLTKNSYSFTGENGKTYTGDTHYAVEIFPADETGRVATPKVRKCSTAKDAFSAKLGDRVELDLTLVEDRKTGKEEPKYINIRLAK